MSELIAFKGAQVAKEFPGYQDGEPFPGKVATVDTTGSDDKPFKIHYDDGDKEWVTLTELSAILVDAELQALACQFVSEGVTKAAKKGEKAKPAAAAAAAGGSRKRQQPEAAAPTATASTGGGKKQRSSSAAAAAGKGPQQPAAAAGEAAANGAGSSKPASRAAAAAAAAASGGAAATDSGAVSPGEFEGLLRDVCRDADRHASRLQVDSRVYRQMYKGPGASSLPKMAQSTITSSPMHAMFTIYGSSTGGTAPDYHAESVDVLDRLAEQLEAASRQTGGKTDRRTLTRMRVYLSSMQDGLPAFKAVWDAWVDNSSVPVLTVLQGCGPFSNGGIVLEADAYMSPC